MIIYLDDRKLVLKAETEAEKYQLTTLAWEDLKGIISIRPDTVKNGIGARVSKIQILVK